jgi:cytochrome c oxidase subunit 3
MPESHPTTTTDSHPPHLAHHFDTPQQQADSGKLAMWIFLATELLMFGGLFCAYTVYRVNHPEVFIYASRFLNVKLGALNTAVLISSSFTMALAVRSVQIDQRRTAMVCMALTILGGAGFMCVKGVEYKDKWEEGLLWGTHYSHKEPATSRPATQPALLQSPGDPFAPPAQFRTDLPAPAAPPAGLRPQPKPGAVVPAEPVSDHVATFFAVYFLMTGLHGIHVLVGIGVIAWVLRRTAKGEFSSAYFTPVDLVGLYWHLVDIIWIFLFPLLYLVR